MLMGIQVIHTVFQVSLTLGTIAELQIWIVLLGSSADSALVVGQLNFLRLRCLHVRFKLLFSLNLLWIDFVVISRHQEENYKIQHSQTHTDSGNQAAKQEFI